ncbi:hypothetical protein [Burkholderia ubonensis]|uniref:hypothetical protein n=1 Tax=Burkholderia ubonensis TaxID=101571 RepID=UPI001E3BE38B|nr:hypothetical protein [Burkholderia ubonensis]
MERLFRDVVALARILYRLIPALGLTKDAQRWCWHRIAWLRSFLLKPKGMTRWPCREDESASPTSARGTVLSKYRINKVVLFCKTFAELVVPDQGMAREIDQILHIYVFLVFPAS